MYGKIKEFRSKLADELHLRRSGYLMVLLAMILATLPNLVAVWMPAPTWQGFTLFLFGLGFPLGLMAVGVSVRVVLWIWLAAAVVAPLTIAVLLSTDAFPSTFLFLAVLETNPAELSVYQGYAWVVGSGTIALVVAYIWVVAKGVPKGFRLHPAVRIVLLVLLGMPLLLNWATSGASKSMAKLHQSLMTSYPTGTLHSAREALQFRQEMEGRSQLADGLQVDVSERAAALERQVHLLVIGESARRASFGIYGYDRETTPMLERTPGLLVFQDVTATAPITLAAVPQMLTPTEPGKVREATALPSVLTAYRAAGFKVYWLSAQRKHGTYDTLTSAFSEDAHESVFLGGTLDVEGRGTYAGTMDVELLPHVNRVLAKGEEKVLILLHTIGSHGPYGSRYPKDLNRFQVDPKEANRSLAKVVIQSSSDPQDLQRVTDAYDNSIFATDCLLANLVHLLRQEDCASWLCYVSDHGENGANAEMGRFMHGILTPDVVQVPLLMWLSQAQKEAFPDKVTALESHLDQPLSASALFHSLLDLGGLSTPMAQESHSFASKGFRPSTRWVSDVSGKLVDYDEEIAPLYDNGRPGGWRPLKPKRLKTAAVAR